MLYAVVAMLMLARRRCSPTKARRARSPGASQPSPGLDRARSPTRSTSTTLVIQQLGKVVRGPIRYPVVLVSAFALSCACAALSYYLLERPAMRRVCATLAEPAVIETGSASKPYAACMVSFNGNVLYGGSTRTGNGPPATHELLSEAAASSCRRAIRPGLPCAS